MPLLFTFRFFTVAESHLARRFAAEEQAETATQTDR